MTLNQSTVSSNSVVVTGSQGGGIYSWEAVTLNQSAVNDNSALGDFAHGAGIYTNFGTVTLNESTVSGNSTSGSTSNGGGIFAHAPVTLTQSTLTDNHAANTTGGGISTGEQRVSIVGSIVAGNTAGEGRPDLSTGTGTLTVNFCLIGTAMMPTAGGNNISTNDPMLTSLADNGGPTKTLAPLTGSPAIDAGNPAALAGTHGVPLYDQRGTPFRRVFNGDGIGGAQIDIGAFELQPAGPALPGDYNADDIVCAGDYTV